MLFWLLLLLVAPTWDCMQMVSSGVGGTRGVARWGGVVGAQPPPVRKVLPPPPPLPPPLLTCRRALWQRWRSAA